MKTLFYIVSFVSIAVLALLIYMYVKGKKSVLSEAPAPVNNAGQIIEDNGVPIVSSPTQLSDAKKMLLSGLPFVDQPKVLDETVAFVYTSDVSGFDKTRVFELNPADAYLIANTPPTYSSNPYANIYPTVPNAENAGILDGLFSATNAGFAQPSLGYGITGKDLSYRKMLPTTMINGVKLKDMFFQKSGKTATKAGYTPAENINAVDLVVTHYKDDSGRVFELPLGGKIYIAVRKDELHNGTFKGLDAIAMQASVNALPTT